MELIVISDHKLKIMLTAPDMKRYALDTQHMDYTNSRTREAFRHIFSDARKQFDFQTDGSRLFIQLFSSKDGGCEIFVTKLDVPSPPTASVSCRQSPKEECALPSVLSSGEKALLQQVYDCADEPGHRSDDAIDPTPRAFAFDSLPDLLAVCHRLLRDGYRDRSVIYIDDTTATTRWYLMLEMGHSFDTTLPLRFAYVCEYGSPISADGLLTYLSEHGRLLCDAEAVSVFGSL